MTNFKTISTYMINTLKSTKTDWPKGIDFNLISKPMSDASEVKNAYYWTVAQCDTAVRPLLMNIINVIAQAHGYMWDCTKEIELCHKIFMTGIKKSIVHNICKALKNAPGLCEHDAEDFEEAIVNFYCKMTIAERVKAINEKMV